MAAFLSVFPFVYDAVRSSQKRRALQKRDDYSEIAKSCVKLAGAITNNSEVLSSSDPLVPTLLQSLKPKYIWATPDRITIEFHGGFDHFGYSVERSDADPRLWTIVYYTEQQRKVLTTITNQISTGGEELLLLRQ